MKRQNGSGSINKVSGNRRKSYKVTVTIGWDQETGKQKKKCLGYYLTHKDASKALIDYLDNPYDLDISSLTFAEIYQKWNRLKYPKVSHSSILGYTSAFENVNSLHSIRMRDIKTNHLQLALDKCQKGHATKRKIKYLFGQLYAYAMQNDIVSKDYSSYVDIGPATRESERLPFSKSEIEILWKYIEDFEWIDTILIMIYSGFRIGELLELEIENIDLENATMIGGIKTTAGKNRLVPIHPKILPLIKKRYEENRKYLIYNHKGKQMTYNNYYREKFLPIMEQLNMRHRPHDCRHTFATLLSNANANSTAIKKMIGHENFITTEKIYTHKDIEELRKNVELIKI